LLFGEDLFEKMRVLDSTDHLAEYGGWHWSFLIIMSLKIACFNFPTPALISIQV
jgi:hypothetical protein